MQVGRVIKKYFLNISSKPSSLRTRITGTTLQHSALRGSSRKTKMALGNFWKRSDLSLTALGDASVLESHSPKTPCVYSLPPWSSTSSTTGYVLSPLYLILTQQIGQISYSGITFRFSDPVSHPAPDPGNFTETSTVIPDAFHVNIELVRHV